MAWADSTPHALNKTAAAATALLALAGGADQAVCLPLGVQNMGCTFNQINDGGRLFNFNSRMQLAVVPAPATYALMRVGLVLLAGLKRRKTRARRLAVGAAACHKWLQALAQATDARRRK